MLRKGDVLLILFVILTVMVFTNLYSSNEGIAISSWNSLSSNTNAGDLVATIMKDNLLICTINLSKLNTKKEIQVEGQYPLVVIAEHNRIRFMESECQDKSCVKGGWLSKKGDFAVCLPNKTIIKILKRK